MSSPQHAVYDDATCPSCAAHLTQSWVLLPIASSLTIHTRRLNRPVGEVTLLSGAAEIGMGYAIGFVNARLRRGSRQRVPLQVRLLATDAAVGRRVLTVSLHLGGLESRHRLNVEISSLGEGIRVHGRLVLRSSEFTRRLQGTWGDELDADLVMTLDVVVTRPDE